MDNCEYKEKGNISKKYITEDMENKCAYENWVPEIGDSFDNSLESLNDDRHPCRGLQYQVKILSDKEKKIPLPVDRPETANISYIPIVCCAMLINPTKKTYELPVDKWEKDNKAPLDYWIYVNAPFTHDPAMTVMYRGVLKPFKYETLWTIQPGEKRFTYQVLQIPYYIHSERWSGDTVQFTGGVTKRIYYRFWGIWHYDDFSFFDPSNPESYSKLPKFEQQK